MQHHDFWWGYDFLVILLIQFWPSGQSPNVFRAAKMCTDVPNLWCQVAHQLPRVSGATTAVSRRSAEIHGFLDNHCRYSEWVRYHPTILSWVTQTGRISRIVDCWLCSNPMNPNTACFWKAFKEMPIYAQARRAHEHKHGNGVAMTLSYQVPTAPCCIGQVAQLKFAWLWTSLFLTLLFDRWGTLKDLDLDLGKSKCHGNIQCLDLEEIHLFWFVKIH